MALSALVSFLTISRGAEFVGGGWKAILPLDGLAFSSSEINPIRRIVAPEFVGSANVWYVLLGALMSIGCDVVASEDEVLILLKEYGERVERVDGAYVNVNVGERIVALAPGESVDVRAGVRYPIELTISVIAGGFLQQIASLNVSPTQAKTPASFTARISACAEAGPEPTVGPSRS